MVASRRTRGSRGHAILSGRRPLPCRLARYQDRPDPGAFAGANYVFCFRTQLASRSHRRLAICILRRRQPHPLSGSATQQSEKNLHPAARYGPGSGSRSADHLAAGKTTQSGILLTEVRFVVGFVIAWRYIIYRFFTERKSLFKLDSCVRFRVISVTWAYYSSPRRS